MMLQASFSFNKKFVWNDVLHTVNRITDNTNFLLETTPNIFKNATLDELLTAYTCGELRFDIKHQKTSDKKEDRHTQRTRRTLSDYSQKTQEASKRKNQYLIGLLADGPIVIDRCGIIEERILEIAVKLEDPKPPHKTTVFRWNKKFKESGGNLDSLICRFENSGGAGIRRCATEVALAEDRLIDEIFLTENRHPISDVVDQMQLEFRRDNDWRIDSQKLKPRSASSIARRVKTLDPVEVVVARHGKEEARRRFRSNGTVPEVKNLLEIVEIDHTPLDLFCIDFELGIPKGRPTLTMAMCRTSKMPWGLNIGFDDCSTEAVLSCIAHGIKPKTYIKTKYPEIQGDWPVYGIPGSLRCDNGPEFHSNSLRIAADDLKINLAFSPKHRPNWKGSIESFLKTFNYSLMHKLPGTTLAKYWHRKEYDPLKAAVIDFNELVRIVHIWIVDIYMRDFHRGLGESPINTWKRLSR
jgi:putative transposase